MLTDLDEPLPQCGYAGSAACEEIRKEGVVGIAQGVEHVRRDYGLPLSSPHDRGLSPVWTFASLNRGS